PLEAALGDGGAAALVGRSGAVATPLAFAHAPHGIMDFWRVEGQRSIRSGDPRFGRSEAYVKYSVAASRAVMRDAGLGPGDVSRAVLPSPDGRGHMAVARELGLSAGAVVDPMTEALGVLGSAHPLVMLAQALETSSAGERVLLSAYGDGSTAMVLEVTDAVEEFKKRRRLAAPSTQISYMKYLTFKRLLAEREEEGRPFSSPIQMSREEGMSVRLHGRRCRGCGTISTLNLRVCPKCGLRDSYEDVKLAKRGVVHTYTQEHYYPTPDPPVTMAVIDLEGGGRYLAQMTDASSQEVRVGMEVEIVFRRLHEGGGYHNYCWKCRPVRTRAEVRTGGEGGEKPDRRGHGSGAEFVEPGKGGRGGGGGRQEGRRDEARASEGGGRGGEGGGGRGDAGRGEASGTREAPRPGGGRGWGEGRGGGGCQ
ncbi:MAG: OB-fold domain-containing protein, partial [Thermoplasmatota archaeon]